MHFWKKRLQRAAALFYTLALCAGMVPSAAFAQEPSTAAQVSLTQQGDSQGAPEGETTPPESTPAQGATVPEEGATVPEEGATVPEDGATEPEEGATVPEDGATEPEEGATEPEQGVTEPEQGVTEPEDGATVPEEGATVPGAAAPQAPAANAAAPLADDNSWLDGDYAYIDTLDFYSGNGYQGKAIMTGTEPWDSDDENGNDTSDSNGTVRSFDVVTYTVNMQNKVREGGPHANYQQGTFHYELILPADTDEARFELDSMGWVTSKPGETHKDVYTTTYNGQTVQVLRGSFTWAPSEGNPTAIGESWQTLNVAVRVLAMTQGDKIQPLFTFWMDHNAVPSEGLVTGSGHTCAQHGVEEYKTLEAPEITVTTAPRYNVALEQGWNTNYLGTFDFSTGNDQAQNKTAGIRNGRVQAFGVTLQVRGKPNQGLRGCEIPDANVPITLDLKLSSTYKKTDGSSVEATTVSGDGFAPLLWSAEGNKDGGTQQDGRAITQGDKYAFLAAPFNSQAGSPFQEYACKNGGTWAALQNGDTVSITVSGYEVDLNRIPNTVAKNATNDTTYYDPAVFASGYWNVQTACFSAGEIWVVQPFTTTGGDQAVAKYGDGQFNLTVQDVNLRATGVSGNALADAADNSSNQAVTDDDRQSVTMALEQPGEIEQYINYSGTQITNACHDDGKDWSLKGANISITEQLAHLGAEGLNTGVAYDDLMKFDDAFFDIESAKLDAASGVDNMKLTLLYGAKPGKSGWDHNGKQPNEPGYDAEMINATADDLIFFTSLQDLENQGYTCVAVLLEARGVASSQSTEIYFTATGKLQATATDGNVYMVTHSAKAWNKGNVQEAAAKALGKEAAALTDADYKEYAQNHFPSRADETTAPQYANDYPAAVWTNDADNREGLKNYKKSEYDENGYKGGTGERNYGDSCLVVNYATQIGKRVMQQSASTQGDKLTYDLDSAQNAVDYALDLSAIRTEGAFTSGETTTTTVYVEDVLPKNLRYIPYSAYLNGTYQQTGEGKQGQVTGGTQIEPQVTERDDGTTTLRWTLTDQTITADATTTIGTIYYSCDISNEAQNNDSLPNTATIWSDDEQRKDFSEVNGNEVTKSIRVSKNSAVSLSKTADQTRVETGKTMGFTMNVGNNAANPLQIIAVDSLPYSGEGSASAMHGDSVVTEFTITELAGEFGNNFKLYYTENKDLQGKGSADFQSVNFANDPDWTGLTVDPASGKVTLPGGTFKPVAIAAVGSLPGNRTLKMHVTITLPDGEPGDRVVNRLTMGNMESNGRSYLFGRTLEGLVWLDADKDGLQDADETKQNGVTVTLLKLKDGGDAGDLNDYEEYKVNGQTAAVTTGQTMDLLTGNTTTGTIGAYKFLNLPEGTFAVRFDDGSNITFADYAATTLNAGDDTIDSDATGVNNSDGKLDYAYIAGIVMPAEAAITGNVYEVKHQDLGLVEAKEETVEIQVTKKWDDNNNANNNRPGEITVQLYVGDNPVSGKTLTLSANNNWTGEFTDLPKTDDSGAAIQYKVKEASVTGYESKVTGTMEDGFIITNTPETVKVEGTKTWADNNNQDGKRPASVTVQLQKKVGDGGWGDVDGKTDTITSSNLDYSFTGLPKYENQQEIAYRVVETSDLNGYTQSGGTKDADGKYNLTNSYTPETVTVAGTKTWNDNDNQDGKRPASVTVQLQKKVGNGGWGDVDGKTDTITSSNLDYSFTGLPKYENQTEIEYRVVETSDLNGYTQSGGTKDDNYDLTNSYTPETVKVEGTKTWNDNDNQDGKRPASVTVQLQKKIGDGDWDDVDGKMATITSSNLHYSFTGLPKYENQQEIAYRVVETGNLNGYIPSGGTKDDNYNLTNSYTPGTTQVTVTKVWDDKDNQDGKRPTSIRVQLKANGTDYGEPVTLTGEGWTYTFSNLPEKANGQDIVYTVVEVSVPKGYRSTSASTPTASGTAITITNTHTPETIDIPVEKVWQGDTDDTYNNWPDDGVTVTLYNGETPVNTLTLTEANDWKGTFEGLPKYEDGAEIQYTVKEVSVPGYTSNVEPNDKGGFTITNTLVTTDIKGTKTWNDANNQDGKRPGQITINLMVGTDIVDTKIVKGTGNTWNWSFENLPVYRNGEQVTYTVQEVPVPGYTPGSDGNNITNTYTPGKTFVRVTKSWQDNNDQDGVRPESITVRLYADNEETNQTLELNAGNNWQGSFTDLDEYKNGKEIAYTVKEEGTLPDGYKSEVESTGTNQFTITNSYTPETTKVKVTKVWEDNNNQDGKRPKSIEVQLLADGEVRKTATITPDAAGNWTTYTFEGLPVYKDQGKKIDYTVQETQVDGYDEPSIKGNAEQGFTITNRRTPDTTKVTVTKKWADDNDRDGKRPDEITVQLLKKDGDKWVEVKDQTATIKPDAEGNWTSYTFTDLPENENGKQIEYSVKEVLDADTDKLYDSSLTGDMENGFTITNTYKPETIDLKGSKTWDDANNQDGIRPESITVHLYADDAEEPVQTLEVKPDDSGNWNWTFTDLYKYRDGGTAIQYTVGEEAVEEYESTVEYKDGSHTLTNTHTPEVIDIPVTKKWADANDQDGKRPDAVTVRLYADGKALEGMTATLNADNGWKHTFEGLPKYRDGGTEIVYTITEDAVPGYTTAVDNKTFTVTNHYTPGKTSVSVTKNWDDNGNQDGMRPAVIEIKLLADGADTGKTLRLSAENAWSGTFGNLDEYKAGEKIRYSVQEVGVHGYESSISGDAVEGYVVTNRHVPERVEVSGRKIWRDASNQSLRPDCITIRLLANERAIAKVLVTAEDDWQWTFTDLPKYENGKQIVYSISEDKVEGYTTTIDGYNVINTSEWEGLTGLPAGTIPQTGDDMPVGLLAGLAAAAAAGLAALLALRKRRSGK